MSVAKKALIIEDSQTDANVMAKIMKGLGYTVSTALTGEEGLEEVKKNKPDLILLDVILPGKNGFLICREIKKNPITRDTKIIIVSSKGQESDLFWGMKQGADAYIPKPFTEEDLIRVLKRISA